MSRRWNLCVWGVAVALGLAGWHSPAVGAEIEGGTKSQLIEVPPDAKVTRHYLKLATGEQVQLGSAVAGGEEQELIGGIVYSNRPNPGQVLAPGANRRIADDLTTVAVGGCEMSGIEVRYSGGGDGTGPGFDVTIAMYTACPFGGGQLIPGTEQMVSLPDNGTHIVLIDLIDSTVDIPGTVWLASTFSRNGAGWFLGTAATIGFTDNFFDNQFFPCMSRFSGTNLYAGFHAQVHCIGEFTREFLAYLNPELSGIGSFPPGANQWIADDIDLTVDGCNMTSYEVAGISGAGPYTVNAELWRSCDKGTVIAGTQKTAMGLGDGAPEVFRFDFPQPIPLPSTSLWVAWQYNTGSASAILSGTALLGFTDDLFGLWEVSQAGECGLFFFGGDPYAGFRLALRCEGNPPLGACCDLTPVLQGQAQATCQLSQQLGCSQTLQRWSRDDACPGRCFVTDTPCSTDDDCRTCSESNTACMIDDDCPQGEVCENDEFCGMEDPFDPPCGSSACCVPPNAPGGEGCQNLFKADCLAIMDNAMPPNPAVWQINQYCNQGSQDCIPWVCRVAEGDCLSSPHDPGCDNPSCCSYVCGLDSFCCDVEWDNTCVNRTQEALEDGDCNILHRNDQCQNAQEGFGSDEVVLERRCSGANPIACTDSDDCDQGASCRWLELLTPTNQGAGSSPMESFCCREQGPGTASSGLWFKFQAPAPPDNPSATLTSVQIDTCNSPGGGGTDSILQIFDSKGFTTDAEACPNLGAITCARDGCGGSNQHALMCVRNLTVGRWYYLLMASETADDVGQHLLRVESPCSTTSTPPMRDRCSEPAVNVTPGSHAYDLRGATFTCPGVTCLTGMENDLWFRVTPGSDGVITAETCNFGQGSPTDTTMVVYETGDCPPLASQQVPGGCNDDAEDNCAAGGSRATFIVEGGQSYTIRIGGKDGSEPFGTLDISFDQDCQPNGRADADDIACGAGNTCDGIPGSEDCNSDMIPDDCSIANEETLDCDENGRLDICDIADDPNLDMDMNGTIDSCEAVAPNILMWESMATHGNGVGEVGLEIPGDESFTEPRLSGISKLVVTFDGAIDPGSIAGSLTMSACTIGDVAVDLSGVTPSYSTAMGDSQLVIEFSPALPGSGINEDPVRYRMEIAGVTGAGGAAMNTGDSVRIMRALLADVNGDGNVNTTDINGTRTIRDMLGGANIDPNEPNMLLRNFMVRADVNIDGRANTTDMNAVRTVRDDAGENNSNGITCPTP